MAGVDFQAGARMVSQHIYVNRLEEEVGQWMGNTERVKVFPVVVPEAGPPIEDRYRLTFQPHAAVQKRKRLESAVRKIAILRSNGLGDFIFAIHAIDALRHTYPEAEIVLLGLNWHAEFLARRPGPIDRVEVVPPSRGVREPEDYVEDPEEMAQFFERMEAEHFDLALQMHGGGRFSNPFVNRLGAQITIGFRTSDAIPLDRWVPYNFYQLEVMRYLELVSLVGASPRMLEPQVNVTESDLAESYAVIPDLQAPLVILHPGAGDPRRRWPVDKFAAVGSALAWANAQVVVIGTHDEQPLADAVVGAMTGKAMNACGRLSINGLTGLLSRATVVISNDSGPLHLAGAVGAATVGIYWCGNLITAGPITRDRHRPAISWRLDCPVCGLNCTLATCGHAVSFVAEVSQEEVTASALELLQRGKKFSSHMLAGS